jgi:hypothetical protein
MSSHHTMSPQLDSLHCRAICEEVGERLRILLDRDATELPRHLRSLLDRFAELDHVHAPSIVPAMDDLAAWATAA